ncbi:vWA domain-containing protein [Gordonia sp. ABSL11-1]|uniref:vWA domain-containing protein n=1 Tax=Gordonia sp. ABSL11-1 TaxID=3053924 RepID=UPI0025734138|nr:vWA domain-containing protein [Gordonia sp. ABSL11-1]MDL9944546.1 vWA domain-containing protein [Gordonia sp. ABSL11-1]
MNTRQSSSPVPVLLPVGLLPDSVIPTQTDRPRTTSRPELRPRLVLPDVGACPGHAVDLIALIDNSPSVSGPGGNDPLSDRISELQTAIHHIAASCRCRRERISLVSFDCPSGTAILRQTLSKSGLRHLERGLLRMPTDPGSSSLGPSLDIAEQITSEAQGKAMVVVLSDFLLTDDHPDDVLERIRNLGADKHVVMLGAEPPSVLEADPTVTVSRIGPSSQPGAVATALTAAFIDARAAGDAHP